MTEFHVVRPPYHSNITHVTCAHATGNIFTQQTMTGADPESGTYWQGGKGPAGTGSWLQAEKHPVDIYRVSNVLGTEGGHLTEGNMEARRGEGSLPLRVRGD